MNAIEFAWEEEAEEKENEYEPSTTIYSHRLAHKPSGYSFLFGEDFVSYRPGPESQQEYEGRLNWSGKRDAVGRWLNYLEREINAPDLWGSLAQERELLGAEPAEAVNTPFSTNEQTEIKRSVNEIRSYITTTYTLADEPLRRVNAKLDYLIDASTRLGRVDWKNIFVGALISLALQQLFPSGQGLRELFAVAGHLLRHVLGGIISPPLLH